MCIRDREYAVYSTIIRIHTEEEVVETLIQDMDRKTGGAIKLTKCHTLKELCAQLSKMFMSGQIARMHLLIDEVDCFLEAISAADYKMCIRDRVSSDAAGEPALSMGGANGSILQSIFQDVYKRQVMTTFSKAALNCGQVRGPVQLGFARSIEEITPQAFTIARVTRAT